jgi:hypothetical protein
VKIWDSIKEVHIALGYNKHNVQKAAKGKLKYKNSYWEKSQ